LLVVSALPAPAEESAVLVFAEVVLHHSRVQALKTRALAAKGSTNFNIAFFFVRFSSFLL
jgi:hypothetical protein